MEIDQEVKNLLEAHRGEWPAIAAKADVSYSWLSKFVRGEIDNPGLETLRQVRDAIRVS